MSICGLGTDIVEVERIAQQLTRSERLAQRVLTEAEMVTFRAHSSPAHFLAKRFAAKEAAVKAIGIGIGNGISWQQVEVQNLPGGQPVLQFSGRYQELCAERGIARSFVSISDEKHFAVATVILESD